MAINKSYIIASTLKFS
ncbi:hypothetical protein F383_08220 [Gossypium arboreum]|uniref:Uncharacterized protein n=1 Tax=Gossypium arboreum TaxID=29729 RepID=A0A0B0P0A3_GOSAR|nr:hypothetical protein F383_08220 [Gossypium arboreum]